MKTEQDANNRNLFFVKRLTSVVTTTCLIALLARGAVVTAQSANVPADAPLGKSDIRFDGDGVLFLGISNQPDSLASDDFSGYHIFSLPCQGSTPDRPRYYRFAIASSNPLERDLLADSADGSWQRWDIVSAALIAEEVHDRRKVDAYREKVTEIVRQLSPRFASMSKAEQLRLVFETMHSRLLVGKYDVACTNLAQTIDSGDFNCVSATVLFHAMAQQAGLDVCGLEMKGHALSRVRVGDRVIDLETTCAEWFRLSEHERSRPRNAVEAGYDTRWSAARRMAESPTVVAPDRATQPGSVTGNAIDPADLPPVLSPNEVPQNLREISDVQLIATIYYNRGVDELTAGRFGAATAFNLKALQLDPHNENAWRNLMATLNNWAIARASKGDYISAAQLLDEGRLIDNDYDLFRANQVHTYYHWIADVAGRRDYETALTLLRLAEDRLPGQMNLRFLNYTIRRKMANELLESRDDRRAFEQFDIAAEIAPPDVNVIEAEIGDVRRHVRLLIDRNSLSRAVWLIDRELIRRDSLLEPGAKHTASNAARTNINANIDASRFAVQLPEAPEVSPVFSRPLVLDDESFDGNDGHENGGRIPVVIKPIPEKSTANVQQPHIASRSVAENVLASDAATLRYLKPAESEMLQSLLALRADAVVDWADESLRRRDYPETIRRLTIGEPPLSRVSNAQIHMLRRTCDEWVAALRSENRHDEVQTLLQWAADLPWLAD